jgi:hypothetical protein
MRTTGLFAAALVLATALAVTAQQNADVILRQTFDSDTGGWTVMGQGGSVHAAGGALAFSYDIKPQQLVAAVLPAQAAFARMRRMRFRVKSDHDSPLAILLAERQPGGGNYTAWFWAAANVWQQVELTPADFCLTDGPRDPADADNKLDLDQLQGVGLVDLGALFAALPQNANNPIAIQNLSGNHTVLIDDFEILGSPAAPPNGLLIDNFDRGFLPWVTLGGIDLKLSPANNPLSEPALQASYEQRDELFQVMLRRVGSFDLSKATRLAFDIASEHEATLLISLELKRPGVAQGPRFTLPIYPPGGREVFHVSIKFADFQGQGTLDPAQLKSILITDISAAEYILAGQGGRPVKLTPASAPRNSPACLTPRPAR